MGIKVNQNLQKKKKSNLYFCIWDHDDLIKLIYIEILLYYK